MNSRHFSALLLALIGTSAIFAQTTLAQTAPAPTATPAPAAAPTPAAPPPAPAAKETPSAAKAAAPATMPIPGSPDPAKAEAGDYTVDPLHTELTFSISHLGFTTYYGAFGGASGTLTLDTKSPAASKLEVTVPIEGLVTTVPALTEHLKGDQWFDAKQFPTMSFKSTNIKVTGKDTAVAIGDLTLHGVTKPITLKVHFHGAGANPLTKKETIGFDVSGKIKRSNFGMAGYVPMIGDEVALDISAAFEK